MRRLLLAAGVLVAAIAVVLVVRSRGGSEDVPAIPTPPGARHGKPVADPFAWTPRRSADFARRATAGTSHLLYTRSPGGVAVSAERTMRFRPLVERAAKAAGVSPDRLEALVFLESAGRPAARAPAGIARPAGLTQIVAETGRDLLGLKVDTARSARYTRRIARAAAAGKLRRAAALDRGRRRADERFDPAKALAATARYLAMAKQRFGREDLAFVSYHMGMGNLEGVLSAYGAGRVPYAQLYFDSTPLRHAAAYRRLASFGDDSSNYFWKLGAAKEILRLAPRDPGRLVRTALLHAEGGAAVLHPEAPPPGGLRELPNVPRDTGLRVRP